MREAKDFSELLDDLVAANGAKWVADQIRVDACPGATAHDVESAQFEGDWIAGGRRAVLDLVAALHEREFGPTLPPKREPRKPIKLRDCKRTGLMMGGSGVAPIAHMGIRATLPVIERLLATEGVTVEAEQPDGSLVTVRSATSMIGLTPHTYRITLTTAVPAGIVATTVERSGKIGLRLDDEPEYDGEYPDGWVQLDWTPCPKCGAPLIWYEAGYAPGYRVCARSPHHHWQA